MNERKEVWRSKKEFPVQVGDVFKTFDGRGHLLEVAKVVDVDDSGHRSKKHVFFTCKVQRYH